MVQELLIIGSAVCTLVASYLAGKAHGRREAYGLRWDGRALVTEKRLSVADMDAIRAAMADVAGGTQAHRVAK